MGTVESTDLIAAAKTLDQLVASQLQMAAKRQSLLQNLGNKYDPESAAEAKEKVTDGVRICQDLKTAVDMLKVSLARADTVVEKLHRQGQKDHERLVALTKTAPMPQVSRAAPFWNDFKNSVAMLVKKAEFPRVDYRKLLDAFTEDFYVKHSSISRNMSQVIREIDEIDVLLNEVQEAAKVAASARFDGQ